MNTTSRSNENGRICSIHLAACCISYLWYDESRLLPPALFPDSPSVLAELPEELEGDEDPSSTSLSFPTSTPWRSRPVGADSCGGPESPEIPSLPWPTTSCWGLRTLRLSWSAEPIILMETSPPTVPEAEASPDRLDVWSRKSEETPSTKLSCSGWFGRRRIPEYSRIVEIGARKKLEGKKCVAYRLDGPPPLAPAPTPADAFLFESVLPPDVSMAAEDARSPDQIFTTEQEEISPATPKIREGTGENDGARAEP